MCSFYFFLLLSTNAVCSKESSPFSGIMHHFSLENAFILPRDKFKSTIWVICSESLISKECSEHNSVLCDCLQDWWNLSDFEDSHDLFSFHFFIFSPEK